MVDTVLNLEKDCPVCSTTGPAQGDEEGHKGFWRCPNEDCPKELFVSSKMQFYDPVGSLYNWTWDSLEVEL